MEVTLSRIRLRLLGACAGTMHMVSDRCFFRKAFDYDTDVDIFEVMTEIWMKRRPNLHCALIVIANRIPYCYENFWRFFHVQETCSDLWMEILVSMIKNLIFCNFYKK